ncbi:MAG TPA: FAD-linked oxidase C-terminal domain-containing protein, partial [Chthoniobacterales bacterium]
MRVGAGVVLDQLNAFLKPHGFCFGPDVATSSRATLGGMIANNSSGARVPVYGTTADHVVALEVVLADGRIENVAAKGDALSAERQMIAQLVQRSAPEIAEWMPPGMLKRWSGYGLARFLQEPDDLTEIFSASEGTLGAICSAELNIVPLPREKGLGLVFFASVAEAMQATVELLALRPSAIEHIDRPLIDQTKGQLHFQAARDLMELDAKPCEAILMVEFYEDVPERLASLAAKRLGLRTLICKNAAEMNLIWAMRKAGLSLLTGRVGPAKPVAFIEDAAVPPEKLPEYVAGLDSIMNPLGLEVCYYGHAATGLLHVRPVLDLRTATDLRKYRQIADGVSALVRQFKGSLAAEHGVGIARTEYMREQVGDHLLGVMRDIKRLFDPKNVFNPGKLIGDGEFKIDAHLRSTYSSHPSLPFEPRLAFAFKDRSFVGNLEQCNGCGGCRKDAPTMCPTFLATGEEYMSTRGRANAIRAALEQRIESRDPLRAYELDEALSNCLSCKACTPECPSNVNMALLKAELMYARIRRDGLTLRARMLSAVDLLGRLGTLTPRIANAALEFAPLRKLMAKTLGISDKWPLPHYAHQRFDRWFSKRAAARVSDRGRVILWDDTFVRYHEPHIGIAAVKVLEALGFEVALPKGRRCCGRPAFSQGNL